MSHVLVHTQKPKLHYCTFFALLALVPSALAGENGMSGTWKGELYMPGSDVFEISMTLEEGSGGISGEIASRDQAAGIGKSSDISQGVFRACYRIT